VDCMNLCTLAVMYFKYGEKRSIPSVFGYSFLNIIHAALNENHNYPQKFGSMYEKSKKI